MSARGAYVHGPGPASIGSLTLSVSAFVHTQAHLICAPIPVRCCLGSRVPRMLRQDLPMKQVVVGKKRLSLGA